MSNWKEKLEELLKPVDFKPIPKEYDCPQCSKKNDIDVKACWWCEVKNPYRIYFNKIIMTSGQTEKVDTNKGMKRYWFGSDEMVRDWTVYLDVDNFSYIDDKNRE